ncbi:hypothetical protein PUMCH_001299 [Australozyma saopauloensis]|uniref:DUF676 domain-containing protein n=1 Tax=Australozyma saopauloensis TaxID=291208 RepID=A0AAX4H6R3_9ASCO|nr:hypothetical protein PUMCH_001299 [[Candida] saopauloensis]
MTSISSEDIEEVHLFVLVHGLWGNPNHLDTIEKVLLRAVSDVSNERIVTIKPSSFRFWKTYDGIQRCSELVIADIFYEIEALMQTNKYKVTQFSMIGYSLGGLISRYVIGRLYGMGFFKEVRPVFFSTFATPHVGSRFYKNKLFDKFANTFGPVLFGKTGLQLFLVDSEKLLVQMADPDSDYFKGLESFQTRILMANIKNDGTVAFYTSFITNYSPFDRLDYVDVVYFEDLPTAIIGTLAVKPKFVDLQNCQKLTSTQNHHGNVQEETSVIRSNKLLRYSILLMAATVILPFHIPMVLTVTFCVSVYSQVKIKLLRPIKLDEHWTKVRDSVYRGEAVDSENAIQGEARRRERLKLRRQESIRGDTSNITEKAMNGVMLAEQNFNARQAHVYEDDISEEATSSEQELVDSEAADSSDFEEWARPKGSLLGKFLRYKQKMKISFEENDQIIDRHASALQSKDDSKVGLFSTECKLPDYPEKDLIIKNLNKLSWFKIPVYFDLFNAHDGVVARSGGFKNPRATSTLFLWGSILRKNIKQKEA